MPPFEYQGRRLTISPRAEMSRDLMPDGKLRWCVQGALDSIQPWTGKWGVVVSYRFPNISCAPTVLTVNSDAEIVWAINKAHRFPNPPLSPFVRPDQALTSSREVRQSITLELAGGSRRPVLLRAMHGLPTPPIPGVDPNTTRWQGNESERLTFWRRGHAYPLRETLIVPGTISKQPPDWYIRP
jgi:hypothetical protein